MRQKQKTKKTFSFRGLPVFSAVITLLATVTFVTLSFTSEVRGQENIQNPPPEPIVQSNISNAPFGFPYQKTFIITAYYSPLPGQQHYNTGSYSAEIRLNGGGVHGASGKDVYPGMIAAPSIYPFGTKMFIPGIGTTAVFDRGGAIVATHEERAIKSNLQHDRLDVWMGRGDEGLKRALAWGRRTVEVTVYGIDSSLQENVYLEKYSETEGLLQKTFNPSMMFKEDIWYLSSGNEVFQLQKILKELGYLSIDPNGFYGDETRDAIFRFQKDQSLVTNLDDLGAGHTGPQTRQRLEAVFKERKLESLPDQIMEEGTEGDNVRKLQRLLNLLGYRVKETGIFDQNTSLLLAQFQKDQGIIAHLKAYGAGFFGPRTREILEQKYSSFLTKVDESQLFDAPDYLVRDLRLGDQGEDVRRLQEELVRLHFLRIDPTGNYGSFTEHAVYKLQQSLDLVWDKSSKGSGIFGSITRSHLNRIVASRYYTQKLIASKKMQGATLLAEGLSFGAKGEDVKQLQNFLKKVGYLTESEITGFFGDKTQEALIAFQKSNKIITSELDIGAGRIGPQTKSLIEKFFSSQPHA